MASTSTWNIMVIEFLRLYLFRCDRCMVLHAALDEAETRGGHSVVRLLESNPCAACGKGQVEVLGKFKLERDE